MLRALGEVLGPDDRVLVIDDDSPDGTGELADRLAAELPLRRRAPPRRGRKGSAARTSPASACALASGAELVLEMDCDFSHDPADVPRLIAAAARRRSRARVALRAGRRHRNWGAPAAADLARRVALRAAAARHAACATRPAASSASGARCSRRSTSTRSPRAATRSRSRRPTGRDAAGFRVVEIPISFTDRRVGQSKMSQGDRRRGDLEGAGAPAGRAAGERVNETTDAELSSGRARVRRPGRSSTSGRRGASRARRSSRSSRRWPPSTARPRATEHRRAPRRRRRATASSRSRRDPVRGRRGSLDGGRRAAALPLRARVGGVAHFVLKCS